MKLIYSPEDDLIKTNHWRDIIVLYLCKQKRKVSLSTIGINVPRPLEVNDKLIDILRADPEQRFCIQHNSPGTKGRIHSYSFRLGSFDNLREIILFLSLLARHGGGGGH